MSERFYSSPTQVFWTCKAFLDGRTIYTKTEFREVKGWRLGAVVHTLRKKDGCPILADYRGPENIAHYRLAPGTDRTRLKFPRSAQGLAETGGAS